MSFIHNSALAGAGGQGGAYEIEQSLRFNSADSAYLNRTPGSSGSTTTWTISTWVKRASLGVAQMIWSAGTSGVTYLTFNADDTLKLRNSTVEYTTNWRFRDPSAWYHIVVKWDTTNSTQADRAIIYVNGVALGTGDYSTYDKATSSEASTWNTSVTHNLGRYAFNGTSYLGGYLAEVNFIDGSALDHEDFGEFDDNGVWRPIEYAGSYSGNSFYLKFASGDGTDSSGLSNTWTANNFTTSGTGTDVMSDTPTTNWATFNPLVPGASNFSNGNLSVTANNSGSANRGTPFPTIKLPTSGKWYAEFTPSSIGEILIGLVQGKTSTGAVGDTVAGYYRLGNIIIEGTGTVETVASFTNGDVIGVIVNADDQEIRFSKNGSIVTTQAWDYSSAPNSSDCYLSFKQGSSSGSCTAAVNYGAQGFAHTPPSGYSALNTSNLPAPDIADGSEYFNTVLWTGNGSSQAITGVGFQTDFLWAKARNQSYSHRLHDAVRGREESLLSNSTGAEFTQANSITSFDTDGFTLGSDGSHNGSGVTYVGWSWLAGNGTSSNTDGSITSTVSANPTAGFSIVNWTVGSTDNQTVGHGLGVPPDLIITKNRDTAYGWATYHSPLGATKYLTLDTTNAVATNIIAWNNTEPTSTVFTVGDASWWGSSTDSMIAYCFAEVEGYSKFGSYTGNGSTDGVFIHLGFKPSFFLLKATSVALESWSIFDSARDPDNFVNRRIMPNNANQEEEYPSSGSATMDFLSNGVKLRASNTAMNGSGVTFIYAAFAENPFGGSGVSPATAR